jgi:hypothetical protein
MSALLVDKLDSITAGLDEAELDNYKLLLGIAAGGLAPHGHLPTSGAKSEAFQTVLKCLAKIQPTGVVWRGRPDFMTDELLVSLQREADEGRGKAIRHDRYFLGYGGPVADRLARSGALVDFVSNHTTRMAPTGVASYLWYDEPGCGLDPHIDTETFTLNGIIMLRHTYVTEPASGLQLYPPDQPAERIHLEPGELLLLYAGGTVHAREDVKPGESISLLTVGFRPIAD